MEKVRGIGSEEEDSRSHSHGQNAELSDARVLHDSVAHGQDVAARKLPDDMVALVEIEHLEGIEGGRGGGQDRHLQRLNHTVVDHHPVAIL